MIFLRYRKVNPKKAPNMDTRPTPKEFIQYILDSSKNKGPHKLDNHIKPIWTSCPFCSMEFDIIGHLEEFDVDSAFISDKMNLKVKKNLEFASLANFFGSR